MSATTAQRLAFAVRTTLAALLAALVALYVQLPQASTSMMTVFIVSQPLAGMVLSKSLFRVAGTVAGAIVAITLTTALSEAPELFAVAISAWIGLCVLTSVFLRDAPQSYGALLSGYTVAIIAFPAVGAPDTIFQAAMDRGAEIVVGIACAATLSQILFPQSAGATLARATEAAVASASRWAAETLRGRTDALAVVRDRRQLVATLARLENLRINAAFESASVRVSGRRMRRLHGRLVSFLALLVSTHDRMENLRAERPKSAEALKPLLELAAEAMAPGASPADRNAAKAALLAAAPDVEAMRADRAKVFERTILVRVADLVDMRSDLARLTDPATPDEAEQDATASLSRYRDVELALVAGAAAFLSQLAFCAFWIASGWSSGAGAAIMVAVMTSLFAQLDDPAKPASVFLVMTTVGSVVAAVYAFAVLPQLEGFEILALTLSPALLALAFGMTYPQLNGPSLAGAIGFINLVGLTNVMAPDFASFANSALAQFVGIGLAATMLRALRPIGAAWPVARLTAGIAGDVAESAAGRGERVAFESRMFDRIDGLMARLDPTDPDSVAIEQGALASLRVGLNALALRRVVRDLPQDAAAPIVDALADLARHFRRLSRGRTAAPPIERLDAALEASLGAAFERRADAADLPVWISAIRMSLAQHPRSFGEWKGGPECEAAPA